MKQATSYKRLATSDERRDGGVNLRSYLIGFGVSLGLTLTSFGLVTWHVHSNHQIFSHHLLLLLLLELAVIQMVVQLNYFLHLNHESRPRWRLITFGFMTVVLGLVVVGSLWIMQNLNYHMANPADSQIIHDENIPY